MHALSDLLELLLIQPRPSCTPQRQLQTGKNLLGGWLHVMSLYLLRKASANCNAEACPVAYPCAEAWPQQHAAAVPTTGMCARFEPLPM